MWSIIQAAGWPIWPLIFASVVALALIFERTWSLRQSIVAPPGLVDRVLADYRQNGLTQELLTRTAMQGPLGRVLAAGLANVKTMDIAGAFNGRRLCENTVGLLEEKGLSSWKSPGAVDKTEWINQIRTITAIFPPYELQEDLHPNYWAQLALRNCLTQAYNAGTPKGGACTISGTGLNGAGQPNMSLH